MANINDFKAKLSGGGARSNQYKVVMPFPGYAQVGGEIEDLAFLCQAAELPGMAITAIEVPFRGRAIKIAGMTEVIEEFPAYHKTQVLGAEKKMSRTRTGKIRYKAMDKPERKKWCIGKAITILITRGDLETVEQIQVCRKKDDLSDVICQLQAYKYIYYVN
jgi:hypothetical protein